MMSRLLGEGHFGHGQPFSLSLDSPCNPFCSRGLSILYGLGWLRGRCLLTSTPYGSRWVSTFILCHLFDVEVSQV